MLCARRLLLVERSYFFVYGCAGCWVWGLLCPSTSATGAVTVGAATAMLAGTGGPPAPATVHGVPGVSGMPGVPGVPGVPGPMHCQVTSSLVGVGVARPVVGSTGETWLRWRSPSPVASSRRSGGSTGLPRFEVLDQVFLPPASGRSFIGGASAWFFLPLWLTAVSLACGLAFAVLLGGGEFPRGYWWLPVFLSFGGGGRLLLIYPGLF